jgi:uncharacterized protein (TIGR02246 family)
MELSMRASTPEDLHRVFVHAFNAGDIESVMALYEAEASLVPQPGLIVRGHGAIRQALQQFLALKGTIEMETTFVIKTGDVALLRGQWKLKGTGPDGKPVEMNGRSVEVARRRSDGTWLLAIDHPFGAGDVRS